MFTNENPEVVIVGGGPIGCWTALQLKKRNPVLDITIYERKAAYERDHILSIAKASLLQWSKISRDSAAFLEKVYQAQATCGFSLGLDTPAIKPEVDLRDVANNRIAHWLRLPKILDIRTIDLERILKDECAGEGIQFVCQAVVTPDAVMALHPNCTSFIAADGANSKMRQALWGSRKEALFERDIYPSLDFNYASHGQAGYLRHNTFDKLGHVYAEYIGIEQDGKSAVNLRMVVSREEYDAIPTATFKEPIFVTPDAAFWDAVPSSTVYNRTLKQDLYDLLALRAEHAHDKPTAEPVKMTKIYLSQYFARKFAKSVHHADRDVKWFLVGDAAMGIPFYRSINSGIILGSQLAFLLTTKLVPAFARIFIYNHYTRPVRILREFARGARIEAKILLYKNVWRPLMHHSAKSRGGFLLRSITDWSLQNLKYGKTS